MCPPPSTRRPALLRAARTFNLKDTLRCAGPASSGMILRQSRLNLPRPSTRLWARARCAPVARAAHPTVAIRRRPRQVYRLATSHAILLRSSKCNTVSMMLHCNGTTASSYTIRPMLRMERRSVRRLASGLQRHSLLPHKPKAAAHMCQPNPIIETQPNNGKWCGCVFGCPIPNEACNPVLFVSFCLLGRRRHPPALCQHDGERGGIT